MTSYIFDSFETDKDYLTLYRSTCCGITCGTPRKHIIPKDMISFITYGRYFNTLVVFFGACLLLFGLAFKESEVAVASIPIFFYSIFRYISSSMVICAGNVWFTSTCCSEHENLLEWFRGSGTDVEMGGKSTYMNV